MPLTPKNEVDILKQIDIFSRKITNNRKTIRYHSQRLPLVVATYKSIRDNLKNYMTKNDAGEVVIDRHKVCAALTLAILKEKIIEVIDLEATFNERSANIILAYLLSQAIMTDFYFEKNSKEIKFNTPASYLLEYQKLISNNLAMLEQIANNPKDSNNQVIFFLSHVYYLMELHSESLLESANLKTSSI